jgi:hypothetical protein
MNSATVAAEAASDDRQAYARKKRLRRGIMREGFLWLGHSLGGLAVEAEW